MPLSVQQVIAKRRQLRVPMDALGFPGESLTVVYRPNFFDEDAEQELNRILADTGASNVQRSYQLFVQSVSEWDLLGADGQPVPVTAPALASAHVPVRLCTYVMELIVADNRLGEANGSPPASTSPPAANSASSPNGTPGSWLPNGTASPPGS